MLEITIVTNLFPQRDDGSRVFYFVLMDASISSSHHSWCIDGNEGVDSEWSDNDHYIPRVESRLWLRLKSITRETRDGRNCNAKFTPESSTCYSISVQA